MVKKLIKEIVMNAQEWVEIIEHLEDCEKAYAYIGSSGYFALVHVIRPLRDRVNSGERSDELAREILDVAL